MNGNPLGFLGIWVEIVVEQATDEGGFADAALADEDEFDFVEGTRLSGEIVRPGADDVDRLTGFFQDFKRKGQVGVVA